MALYKRSAKYEGWFFTLRTATQRESSNGLTDDRIYKRDNQKISQNHYYLLQKRRFSHPLTCPS